MGAQQLGSPSQHTRPVLNPGFYRRGCGGDGRRRVCDSLFRELTHLNAEGVVARLGDDKEGRGVAFDEATINHLLHVKEQVLPNAMAGLSLAWQHRDALLRG
jgi:hypothetical protein